MVIDSSAVLAILFAEPDARDYAEAIEDASLRLMSAATFVETSIVLEASHGPLGASQLEIFIHQAGIEIVPVDVDQAEVARSAWRRFGKGNHRARLNFGDLFAYALAKSTGEPLLFKGQDFAQTDVTPAIAP
jgi:ribonuclease VapC